MTFDLMSEQIIKAAIDNLVNESKKILIPNSIITLTSNLGEACTYDDFYRIDYIKYAKKIIDNSNLSPNRKEEIHKKFNKTPSHCAITLKEKDDFFTDPGELPIKLTPTPLKVQISAPNLVNNNIIYYDDLIEHPPKFRKTIYCLACKNPIEEKDLAYYLGYPYHSFCIKCMKCSNNNDSSPKTIDHFICITPGLFLCRQHYREYMSNHQLTDEISVIYHEKNIKNFIKEVFNVPFKNEETFSFNEEESDDELINNEIIEESIPIKRPYDDFVSTFTIRFDRLPQDIDYEKLEKLVGNEFTIVNVEKGSAIIKWAYLADICKNEKEKKTFIKKCQDLINVKFKSTIGKGVVGNIISEPIYSIPDDKNIQDEYNKPWLNVLQNMHELDDMDLDYIKKTALEFLKSNDYKKNWAFIFDHENLYEDVEKQIMKDVSLNEIEMTIVAQTIITNKNIDKYNQIVSSINKSDLKQFFVYHGTRLKNHQKIINKHFLMPGKDFLQNQTDSGYFGKGIYGTDNMFYAAKYANGYSDLDFNQKAHVICCMAVYNNKKIIELNDLSFYGKTISSNITENYGIHHAFVGSSSSFHPIPRSEKDLNYISAEEFVFPNKFQIIPIYSFTVMRKDHFILWKDENVDNEENNEYLQKISRKTQVNVYNTKSVDEAISVIWRKRRNKFKLITNGGGPEQTGRKLIDEARKITKSNFVCLVFAYDKRHLEWVSERENVLFTSEFEDFKNFVNLNLNEDDVYNYAIELQNKHDYKFKINKNQMLSFPPTSHSSYNG